jgi:MFS family permease
VFLAGAGFLQIGRELGFGPAWLGVLTASFFLAASVSSTPLGRVVERVGWQRAMRINAVASASISLAIAVTARHTMVLVVLLVAAGAVYGFANPAANLALAQHIEPRKRAFAFGLKHAGIPASTLVAGLAVPVVILSVGWRFAYVVAAALALLVAAIVPGGDLSTGPRFEPDHRRAVAPMSNRLLVMLAASSSLASWGAIALGTYMVGSAVDAGLSEANAGWLLFAGSLTTIASRLVIGALTDRFGGRGFAGFAALTAAGALLFGAMSTAAGAAFAVLALLAYATGWGWPGLMTFSVVNANAGSAASSSAIAQAGVFIGAGVGPIVIGVIVAAGSYQLGWAAVAVASAVASLIVFGVGRRALAVPVS